MMKFRKRTKTPIRITTKIYYFVMVVLAAIIGSVIGGFGIFVLLAVWLILRIFKFLDIY